MASRLSFVRKGSALLFKSLSLYCAVNDYKMLEQLIAQSDQMNQYGKYVDLPKFVILEISGSVYNLTGHLKPGKASRYIIEERASCFRVNSKKSQFCFSWRIDYSRCFWHCRMSRGSHN